MDSMYEWIHNSRYQCALFLKRFEFVNIMTLIAVEILTANLCASKREIKMESIFFVRNAKRTLSFTNQILFSRAYLLGKSALHSISCLICMVSTLGVLQICDWDLHLWFGETKAMKIKQCQRFSIFKAAFVSAILATNSSHEQYLPKSIDNVDGHRLFAASKKHKNTGYNGHKRQISLHTSICAVANHLWYRERTSAHFGNFARISMHAVECVCISCMYVCVDTIHASKGRP